MIILTYDADHPVAQKHLNFTKWARQNGYEINRTKLKVYGEFFRGIHATTAVKSGQELIRAPVSLMISSQNFENTSLGKMLDEKKLLDSRWREPIFPVLFYMEEKLNPNSKYKPWIDVISPYAYDQPIFFTKEEKEWLKGSYIISK